MHRITRLFLWLLILTTLMVLLRWLLTPAIYLPKPTGHPRIILPKQEYVRIKDTFPYSFDVSRHAIIKPSSKHGELYWIDLYYPDFDATIKLTYKPVKNSMKLLREYCYDAYTLTAKHQVKASSIQEKTFTTPQGYSALIAELKGEVPSQVQFHTTDGTHHFLRGALYFNTATQNDYLAPIINFIHQDIIHLLQTLEWRQSSIDQ